MEIFIFILGLMVATIVDLFRYTKVEENNKEQQEREKQGKKQERKKKL